MPGPWRRTNPLALAVLTCLLERPMHPYEVAQTLRHRAKHESIKLNYGSLYNVVDALERHGFIEARETVKAGRRPERTVYAITPAGTREMNDWLADLVATPAEEFPQFIAALSLLAALPPEEAVALLEQRADALELQLAAQRGVISAATENGLPRLFTIEEELRQAFLVTEIEFVHRLVKDIESGELDGLDLWRSFYQDS
jgi:DNA-binding PadR family transcriptional regulator